MKKLALKWQEETKHYLNSNRVRELFKRRDPLKGRVRLSNNEPSKGLCAGAQIQVGSMYVLFSVFRRNIKVCWDRPADSVNGLLFSPV